MSAPIPKPAPCTTGRATSFPKRCNNLQHALRLAYAGPKAAERLAHDGGMSVRSAGSALSGRYPRAWEAFLRLIEKTPTILAHALETTWAEELRARHEIASVRQRLDEIERGLNAKDSSVARAGIQPPRGLADTKR